MIAPGPSALLTNLLARLPDATNRSLIDQAAVDFAFLNSKAGRKRLVKVIGYQVLLLSELVLMLIWVLVLRPSPEESDRPITVLRTSGSDIEQIYA